MVRHRALLRHRRGCANTHFQHSHLIVTSMALSRDQIEWAAVFLAAGELMRRGYDVSFTLGPNAPLADLVVRSPRGRAFIVDVKGKCRPGPWRVKPKAQTPGLFYILVRLGMTTEGIDRGQDRFYVLGQAEAAGMTRLNSKNPGLSGFSSSAAAPYKEGWDRLPS